MQSLGKLPAEYRESLVLHELFGDQNLFIYPPGDASMRWMLPHKQSGHQIHIGFRGDQLIVRAYKDNKMLELVPREGFLNPENIGDFDLPSSLVLNCVHLMDVGSGYIEVRRKPNIWRSLDSNWIIDFHARRARRRTVFLVYPHSALFKYVTRIFNRWEYSNLITVFQPAKKNLSVELRRMELSFVVNREGFLQSRQLQAEIDDDQDCGCWHGLNSKFVLRNVDNPRQRSVIVHFGELTQRRKGPHVMIDIANDGSPYCRYAINDVLGRIESPIEPRVIYFKALLHAITSFVYADTLTSRTGSEEALEVFRAGISQPRTPLNTGPYDILKSIAKLSPKPEYYPVDLKKMKMMHWDPSLTTTIQHEGLRSAVELIREKSEHLAASFLQRTQLSEPDHWGSRHLFQ